MVVDERLTLAGFPYRVFISREKDTNHGVIHLTGQYGYQEQMQKDNYRELDEWILTETENTSLNTIQKKKEKNNKQLQFSSTNSLIILKCALSMLKWIS